MSEEIWKDVVGYEGLYMVSDLGRIKRIKGFRCRQERLISLDKMKDGYLRAALYLKGVEFRTPAHRLVAIAFIENPENKPEVNHKNGIKWDNKKSNLEWVTKSENGLHAFQTGLNKITEHNVQMTISRNKERNGSKHPLSIPIIDIVTGKEYVSIREAAKNNNIKELTLARQLRGYTKNNNTNLKYKQL